MSISITLANGRGLKTESESSEASTESDHSYVLCLRGGSGLIEEGEERRCQICKGKVWGEYDYATTKSLITHYKNFHKVGDCSLLDEQSEENFLSEMKLMIDNVRRGTSYRHGEPKSTEVCQYCGPS